MSMYMASFQGTLRSADKQLRQYVLRPQLHAKLNVAQMFSFTCKPRSIVNVCATLLIFLQDLSTTTVLHITTNTKLQVYVHSHLSVITEVSEVLDKQITHPIMCLSTVYCRDVNVLANVCSNSFTTWPSRIYSTVWCKCCFFARSCLIQNSGDACADER